MSTRDEVNGAPDEGGSPAGGPGGATGGGPGASAAGAGSGPSGPASSGAGSAASTAGIGASAPTGSATSSTAATTAAISTAGSATSTAGSATSATDSAGIDADAYDVLRERLGGAARELARRAGELNARRQEVFGGGELRLAGTERLGTAHPSLPADLAPVGPRLLFAANPAEVGDVGDVFQWGQDGGVPGLLDDPGFVRDFRELYRYYRQTRLLRLRVLEGRLLAVFATGPSASDVKALAWRVGPDGSPAYEGTARETAEADGGAYAVAWTPAGREAHVPGRRPHMALGGVTLDPTGGTLTLTTGGTVHEEPVDDALQSLADAEVAYAAVEPLLLLRVRPYHEDADRYFAVNTRHHEVHRLDAIGQACLRLPDGQGVIFPGGYALATGGTRTFDVETAGLRLDFERLVRSANGEDVLYVFHAEGRRLLLPYNLIREEVAAPLFVQGCALYEDGTLLTLRAAEGGEPARVHTLQRWATPFVSDIWAAAQPTGADPLERIGNADLVRAVSDALSVARSALESAPSTAVYEALVASCERVLDRHHWLADEEAGDLAGPLTAVRDTGRDVLAEYARVSEATARAGQAVEDAAARIAALVRRVRGEAAASADEWVARLTELRRSQGALVTLRDLRYADTERLDALAASLTKELAAAAGRAAEHFAGEHAFDGYRERAAELAARAAALPTAADGEEVAAALDEQAAGLATVTETAATLEIADATVRTRILAAAADVLGAVNQARAVLEARRRDLLGAESQAEFAAESALLAQSVSGALAAADTPEACDEHLGRLLVQLENLATRFATSDDRLAALGERRDEIQQTFAARKQALADERAQRAQRLASSAARLLDGVRRRAAALPSADDVNTYFATDPMAAEHRRIAKRLRTLGDPARAAELDAALAAARQDTGRALRDRQDLYEDGGAAIRLGRHRFAVNTRPFDLALVPHDGGLAFTVTGTDYLAPVTDPAFAATRRFWDRPLVSETPALYRAEYLAATLLLDTPWEALADPAARADLIRQTAAARLDEGYERGVHDHDAALLLTALHELALPAALLRYPPQLRAAAQLFWTHAPATAPRAAWTTRARSLTRAASFGAGAAALAGLAAELGLAARDFALAAGLDEAFALPAAGATPAPGQGQVRAQVPGAGLEPPPGHAGSAHPGEPGAARAEPISAHREPVSAHPKPGSAHPDLGSPRPGAAPDAGLPGALDAGLPGTALDHGLLGEYLVAELAAERPGFVAGPEAEDVARRFAAALGGVHGVPYKEFLADLDALRGDLAARWQLALGWLAPFAGPGGDHLEAAAALVCGPGLVRYEAGGPVAATVEGLLGAHPRVTGGRLALRLDDLLTRARRHRADDVPAYRGYQRHRTAAVAAERRRLNLEAYRPRPLTGFVRNRLLDEVYLPLVGDSLAKQFGTAGGLLMLMSPPGYGKSSLVEYVAARLGLALVTVSGPALGTGTTSLDPERAPDASARREVEKIGFALALGSNVLLHVDDIQHTSPELLQKFIPLCDAGRRVEGPAGTYDLRGKRFAVCMSGNPYTESGRLFRVPDMLANRADVWSLGDVLTGREEAFALSYVENALTANPVLAPLAARDRADLELLLRLAAGDPAARADDLGHPYPPAERAEITAVLRHLLRARAVLLTVNAAYIASAGQSDRTRTEPPFLLQGSYRDMNRLAARVVPAMHPGDVEALLTDHYRAEAQTLAGGAEAALLKLAELRGTLTPAEAARWTALKSAWPGATAPAPVG